MKRVAVIGAGVSGLIAARTVRDQGLDVLVFEKSRGLGGRVATRRHDDIGFDHGAQYFTAREEIFSRAVEDWLRQDIAAPWGGRMGHCNGSEIVAEHHPPVRYVAQPGMSALGRHLAEGLDVRKASRVAAPTFSHGQWHLETTDGTGLGRFDTLIVSAPAPQAETLIRPVAPSLADRIRGILYAPCWTLMLQLESDVGSGFDGVFFDAGPIRWAAHNSSKPGRGGRTWVLHATPEWSSRHLDDEPANVAARLTESFAAVISNDPLSVISAQAHRWLYARVENPLVDRAVWDPVRRLGLCGDWCSGPRIEDAYLSGLSVASHVLGDAGVRAAPANTR
jgi:predicted NAD/FAD-dependent oxidoreductase